MTSTPNDSPDESDQAEGVDELLVGSKTVMEQSTGFDATGQILADSAYAQKSHVDMVRQSDQISFPASDPAVTANVGEDLFTNANKPEVDGTTGESGTKASRQATEKPGAFDIAPVVAPDGADFARPNDAADKMAKFSFTEQIDTRSNQSESASVAELKGLFEPSSVKDISTLSKSDNQAHDHTTWAPKLMKGELPKSLAGWKISSFQLVSTDRFIKPRVYQSKTVPSIEQIKKLTVATRDATEAEISAVKRLSKEPGKHTVIDRFGDSLGAKPVLVAAIRIKESCQRCHSQREGDLIGAFTFSLSKAETGANLFDVLD